ncbi:MAG: VOC family protein [Nocardioidaceae bacterium]|jgi:catechol 2,3-dioxygenase-like lactoylglutathione lyase family enzyme|nr:VOC family protein [Nocardioidaceae bacterium]
MIDHLGIQVADPDASAALYTDVFGPLGLVELMTFDVPGGRVIGMGWDRKPFLWVSPAREDAACELHVALAAGSRDAVDAVHAAALARGVEVLHPPRLWPEYHPGYYAVFVRDLDGHNVEAVFHDWSVGA